MNFKAASVRLSSKLDKVFPLNRSIPALIAMALILPGIGCRGHNPESVGQPQPLAKIKVARDARTFVTSKGKPFAPFGVNYYRPGTGWAPQVWKKFDPEATRQDFRRMKSLGVNCVRVFLTYGSFYTT